MKKTLMIALALFLMIGVSACGSTNKPSTSGTSSANTSAETSADTTESDDDGSSLGIDLTSESLQTTTATDKLSQEDLAKFVKDVFGDKITLSSFDDASKYTYGDCKGLLGTDANMYDYDKSSNKRRFYWISSEADNARLMLVFTDEDGDGAYTLKSYGAPNLPIE